MTTRYQIWISPARNQRPQRSSGTSAQFPSSSYPTSANARALIPNAPAACASASSRPWVTQTSGGVDLCDGGGELGPVAVVGDDERELDAALAGAGADLHPARGHADDRVGEAADPGALEGRGGAEDDLAGEVAGAALSRRVAARSSPRGMPRAA